MFTKVDEGVLNELAKQFSIEPALLLAIQLVEVGENNRGFFPDGRPIILFEGHIMYRELKGEFGKDFADKCALEHPSIVHKRWDRSKYLGGIREWDRLNLAVTINETCALQSASWGIFQIMGFNYAQCGCSCIHEFVYKMSKSWPDQFKLGLHFMYNTGCLKLLKAHDWEGFARKYNGPSFKANAYDQKLKNAYENFSRKLNEE